MSREHQDEFLFADGPTVSLHLPHPLEDYFAEVAARWGVPLGQKVRVRLQDPGMPELCGRLELAHAPDMPLDPREKMKLRLSGVDFCHRDLASWTLL